MMTTFTISLHNHAAGPDAARHVAQGVHRALERGIDVICFVAHNSSTPFDEFRRARRRMLADGLRWRDLDDGAIVIVRDASGDRVLLLRGNEVTTREGEILAIGDIGEVRNRRDLSGTPTSEWIRYPAEPRRLLDLATVIDLNPKLATDRVILVAPHPWDRTGLVKPDGRGFELLRSALVAGTIDTYESYNAAAAGVARFGVRDINQRAQELERSLARAGITGNDSLWPDIDRATTTVEMAVGLEDPDFVPALKEALRSGERVRNRERPLSLASLVRRAMTSRRNPLVRWLGRLSSGRR